jgi:hypothetical protein
VHINKSASGGVVATLDTAAIGTACFGACLQELVYWYDAKTKLSQKKYQKLLHSVSYWIICVFMILGSGYGTWLWFYPESQSLRTYLLFGAAFPVLFKKLVSAFVSRETKLGLQKEDESSALRNYFSLA